MIILGDSNIDADIIKWLRTQGHDVLWAVDLPPSMSDADILSIANQQKRIVITYDRDFGDLVFRSRLVTQGIVLLRYRAATQYQRLALFKSHWPYIEQHARGNFIVATNDRIRKRPLG